MDQSEPEIWKPVVGYEGRYEVSNKGRVKALFSANHGGFKVGRIIKPILTSKGYVKVGLYDSSVKCRQKNVHCIVLEAFKGPRPPNLVVRHLDGSRTNNTITNLEWGTSAQNAQDAKNHGTFVVGEKNGQSKLTSDEVLKIRSMRDEGIACSTIAKIFNVDWSNVWLIGKRKSWKHL
jgi:hypothetical protein